MDHVICRDYIVNRRFFIYCSLACHGSGSHFSAPSLLSYQSSACVTEYILPVPEIPNRLLSSHLQVQTQDLSKSPAFGDHTPLFDAMLLAFEQTDYCNFEVQFEVVRNAIHFLVGGFAPYSLATLHYSAFDPIFYLHHSSVDRQWAIWQKLQTLRGLPYKVGALPGVPALSLSLSLSVCLFVCLLGGRWAVD